MRHRPPQAGAAALLLAAAAALDGAAAAAADDGEAGRLARGEYLFHAGLCAACHTAEDGPPLAGGRPIETPFGTFYSSNITPDPEHGIGAWSDADFVRALRDGVSPAGQHYYPAFPYPAYTRLRREDMLALKAYLDTFVAQARPNRAHDLLWYAGWRWPLGLWKWLYFEPGAWQPDPARSARENRGAYLAEAALHCAACHSPRNALGAIVPEARYSGADSGIEGSGTPNITPHRETGIGRWNPETLAFYLEIGMDPDGDFAGGAMAPVIDLGTSKLTSDDRRAVAEYILSLPPRPAAE